MFIEHLPRAMLVAGDAAWIRKSFPGLKELVGRGRPKTHKPIKEQDDVEQRYVLHVTE